jgi:hypothetical protein
MEATIQAVQPYELHGVRYYALLYLVADDPRPREARLSHDMVYADPQPGDRVDVRAILGIVDRVTKLA